MGSDRVLFDSGSHLAFDPETLPRDLLLRIAQGSPLITSRRGKVVLRSAEQVFANVVAEAIAQQAIEGESRASSELQQSTQRERFAVVVPGWWSPPTVGRVHDALQATLSDAIAEGRGLIGAEVLLVNSAEAAVTEYLRTAPRKQSLAADNSTQRSAIGDDDQQASTRQPSAIAVIDARAAFTSVVIVHMRSTAPTALTTPTMVIAEGGDRLDALVLQHCVAALSEAGDTIDRDDTDTIAAGSIALSVCRAYREQLSRETVASIELELPGASQPVRFVRSDLEALATPWAQRVVSMANTVISDSNLPVDTVLITGGLSAMPLLSQLVSSELGLEVLAVNEPASAATRGAALVASAPQVSLSWRARLMCLLNWRSRTTAPRTQPKNAVRPAEVSQAAAALKPSATSKPVTATVTTAVAPSTGSWLENFLAGRPDHTEVPVPRPTPSQSVRP